MFCAVKQGEDRGIDIVCCAVKFILYICWQDFMTSNKGLLVLVNCSLIKVYCNWFLKISKFSQIYCKESRRCCHGPVVLLAMGDSGTSTVLT